MTIFLTKDPRFVLAQFVDTVPVTYSIIEGGTSIKKNGHVCIEQVDEGEVCLDGGQEEMVQDADGATVISADVRFDDEWRTVPITECSILRADGSVRPLLWTRQEGIHINP